MDLNEVRRVGARVVRFAQDINAAKLSVVTQVEEKVVGYEINGQKLSIVVDPGGDEVRFEVPAAWVPHRSLERGSNEREVEVSGG